MAQQNTNPAYRTFSVTCAAGNTTYALAVLLRAVDATLVGAPVREFSIQAEPDTNTGVLLVGDENTSATRYGYKLKAGDTRVYRSSMYFDVYLEHFYVRSDTAGYKINIEICA